MEPALKNEYGKDCLTMPGSLYGRSAESDLLKAAYSDAEKGRQATVFISGYAGLGKTALVHDTVKALNLSGGYFISGKSDQLEQNIPYAPVTAALSSLVRQWMTVSQEELDRWKKRISRALLRSGRIMTELIPELKWIIGEPPEIEPLPPAESQNRFKLVLRSFLSAVAGKDRPLILFLDDLQWADPATVQLLQFLTRDAGLNYVLTIGAYREAEAKENDAFSRLLAEYGRAYEYTIPLKPLFEDQAAEWMAETLGMDRKRVSPLASSLHRSSGGNPFFFRQLLSSLCDEGLLYRNDTAGAWHWDQAAVQALRPGEDVLAFLVGKFKRLPKDTLALVKLASCIGSSFQSETLALVTGKTPEENEIALQWAVTEGLVAERTFSPYPLQKKSPRTFEFVHDRVQQAVYSLIPENEKKRMHVTIGRLMMGSAHRTMDDTLLPVMDHFSRGLELIKDPLEKTELARLSLLAGRKAKSSAAYASAMEYFRAGITLLPPSPWDSEYEITYELHLELAQAEYLSANVKKAEALFDTVIAHSKTELSSSRVYGLKVVLYAGMGRYDQAVQTGIQALLRLGVKLTVPPGPVDYTRQLLLSAWRIHTHFPMRVQSPQPESEKRARVSELLARLACIISIHDPRAYLYTIIKFANYATKYGRAGMAAVGYMGYGIIADCVFCRHQTGYGFALQGLALAERSQESYPKCYVHFVMGALLCHWTQPAHTAISYLDKAVEYGVEAGDLLLAGYASRFILETDYLCGHTIDAVLKSHGKAREFARRGNLQYLAINTELYLKILTFLKEGSNGGFCFDPKNFEEESFLSAMKNDNASKTAYRILKMQLCFLADDYQGALQTAGQIRGRLQSVTGFLIYAEFVFYEALAAAACFHTLSPREKKRCLNLLRKNRRRMGEWENGCKHNFRHKHLLLCAETARLDGRKDAAMSLYDQAIQAAHDHGYLQDEALALELAARYYLNQKRSRIAAVYMEDACRLYISWGAKAKADALYTRYANLMNKPGTDQSAEPVPLQAGPAEELPDKSGCQQEADEDALHQAILMISGQDKPDGILESFLTYAVTSAGADKGILMLEREGKLWLEMMIEDSIRAEQSKNPVPMERGSGFYRPIIRYVFRTAENAVWQGLTPSSIFAAEAYAAKEGVSAIACLPVLFRGIPAGVLYLESKQNKVTFTDSKMRKLSLLTKQLVTVKKLLDHLEGGQGVKPVTLTEPLTGREEDVLRLIAAGLSNKEIADNLHLSANTVKGYIKSLYGKLGANRRVQVAAQAKRFGLLKSD